LTPRVLLLPSTVKIRACRIGLSCSVCMFSAAAEAQTHHRRVVKLCFFSSCFEYLDLFVGNRIVCASESCFSRKVMSEVSVSRMRRSPSARSALAAYVYSVVFRIHFRSSRKARKTFWRKRSFLRKISTQRGFPHFSPRGRVGLCRGKADPSLMTKLCVGMRHTNNLKAS
jgi:hypothetical protein